MSIENLGALHLLWPVLLLPLLGWWAARRRRRDLRRLLSRAALPRLQLPSASRGWLRLGLRVAGLLCLVLVLMDFRAPEANVEVEVDPRGVDLVVLLDVSNSMLATDVAPNRLERAKLGIADLAQESIRAGDRVGLVLFAGSQVVRSPLTVDHGFFLARLREAGPQEVSRGGTLIGDALRRGLDLFASGQERGVDRGQALLLLTDGEDQGSFPLEAAAAAAEQGVVVFTVGIGDPAGAPITLPDASTLRYDGEVVRSRLDEQTLRQIADLTRGAYVPAGTLSFDLDALYRERLAPLARGEQLRDTAMDREALFQLPLLGAILCLLAELLLGATRRAKRAPVLAGAPLLAGALLLGLGMPVHAQEPDPRALYAQGDYEQALAAWDARLAELPPAAQAAARYERGRALYALQRWADARVDFRSLAGEGAELGRQARVAAGHCLLREAEAGAEDAIDKVVEALGNYRDVLREDPSHPGLRRDAEVAKHLLRRLIAQQQEQQEQQDGEQQDGEQQDGEQQDGEQQDGEQQDGEQQDGEQQDGEQQDGEQQDGEQQDGEQQDGEQQDGEQQDGEQQDGAQQAIEEGALEGEEARRWLERLIEQLEQAEARRPRSGPPPQKVERDW